MIFKNVSCYSINENCDISDIQNNEILEVFKFKQCDKMQRFSIGFENTTNEKLVHEFFIDSQKHIYLSVVSEEKIIPSSGINCKVKAIALEISKKESRNVGKKEKDIIRDNVIAEYLPSALSKTVNYGVVINLKTKIMYINKTSQCQLDDVINFLREANGGLSVIPFSTNNNAMKAVGVWIESASMPSNIKLDGDCRMQDVEDTGHSVTFKSHDLCDDEVKKILNLNSMEVKQIRMFIDDHNSDYGFTLNDKLQLKKINIISDAEDDNSVDIENDEWFKLESELILSISSISYIYLVLCDNFGGIKQ